MFEKQRFYTTPQIQKKVSLMSDIRYSLEKYKGRSSRHHCPQCKKRTFTKYMDNHTGKYLSDNTGGCNRVEKCGYHYTPKMYFERNAYTQDDLNKPINVSKPIIKPPSFTPKDIMLDSLTTYHQNNFAIGLSRYFSKLLVTELLHRYYVGIAKGNKTIFWQVNRLGK